jgi:hypothetical protein
VARLGRSEQVLYEERHWVPWWMLAVAFAVPVALLTGLAALGRSQSDSDALSPLVGALVGAAFGLFFAGFFWANHARRVIRVTDRALRIGSRAPILLEEIEILELRGIAPAPPAPASDRRAQPSRRRSTEVSTVTLASTRAEASDTLSATARNRAASARIAPGSPGTGGGSTIGIDCLMRGSSRMRTRVASGA